MTSSESCLHALAIPRWVGPEFCFVAVAVKSADFGNGERPPMLGIAVVTLGAHRHVTAMQR